MLKQLVRTVYLFGTCILLVHCSATPRATTVSTKMPFQFVADETSTMVFNPDFHGAGAQYCQPPRTPSEKTLDIYLGDSGSRNSLKLFIEGTVEAGKTYSLDVSAEGFSPYLREDEVFIVMKPLFKPIGEYAFDLAELTVLDAAYNDGETFRAKVKIIFRSGQILSGTLSALLFVGTGVCPPTE